MEVQTFRARSMQEALQLVRRTLGPDAAVLQAKEVGRGAMSWLTGAREIEVLALTGVQLPSRFADSARDDNDATGWSASARDDESLDEPGDESTAPPPIHPWDYRAKFRADLRSEAGDLPSLVEQLASSPRAADRLDLPPPLDELLRQMLQAEIDRDLARDLIDRVCCHATDQELADPAMLQLRLVRSIEQEIQVSGPIRIAPSRPHVVALIGPTGVGKTTTIAKLAADFRLRKQCRVGLINVDTYRIAAVEQLRTYAEIIDLPMEVVSTPREMRLAVDRLSGLDLVLIDTAGRSPRDGVRIQELKSLLGEARADEVHLVLSAAAGTASLIHATQRFRHVGVTSLLLTKLDEAAGPGGLLSLLRDSQLPLSYLTDGQNVPDDIRVGDRHALARMMLGLDSLVTEAYRAA
ncbi:MAG: flagellar biosynthesis protein FlhF [Pirellulaceae bacterium]|nr:flagellar biosynthesis protein FlhF [Pirellulaceae bacterium]